MLRNRTGLSVLIGAALLAARPAAADGSSVGEGARTDAWDGKFRYGAYSTLISSTLIGTEFKVYIDLWADPETSPGQIDRSLARLRERYDGLADYEIRAILERARDDRSLTAYEEERSIIGNDEQNSLFISGMNSHPELSPVDNLIRDGRLTSTNFQFNTHRSLYNNAFGIPQNSTAGVVNAWLVGIRSAELDVMQTRDGVSVVLHDLGHRLISAHPDSG